MPLAGDVGEDIDLANSEPSRSNATVLSNATALYPHTLTSGPESGLCNQLMALVGYVLLMSSIQLRCISCVVQRSSTIQLLMSSFQLRCRGVAA